MPGLGAIIAGGALLIGVVWWLVLKIMRVTSPSTGETGGGDNGMSNGDFGGHGGSGFGEGGGHDGGGH